MTTSVLLVIQSDDGDTAYAQQFVNKVQETLADDDKFERFLLVMQDCGNAHNSSDKMLQVRVQCTGA